MNKRRRESKTHIWSMGAALLISCASNAAFAQSQGGALITFEDILQAPDSAPLNMRYARQQSERGDVVSALGAVERVLFSDPENDEARNFYVYLLLQADDGQAAMRELKLLEGRVLSSQLQQAVNDYRNQVGLAKISGSDGKSSGGIRGTLSAGARYDSNAGNALVDANLLGGSKDGDFAGFLQGGLQASAPVSDSSQVQIRGGVNGQIVRYLDVSRIDNESLGANIGFSGGNKALQWHIDGLVRQVSINNTKYLSQFGPKLRLMKQMSPETRLHATAAYFDQNYDDIPGSVGEDGRSGGYVFGEIGAEQKVGDRTTLAGFLNYTDKGADVNIYAYDGFGGKIAFNHYRYNESYFKLNGSYQKLDYNGGTGRKDDRWKVQATAGGPIGVILGETNDDLDNLIIEGSVRYVDRGSNTGALDFDSFGAEMRLVWGF